MVNESKRQLGEGVGMGRRRRRKEPESANLHNCMYRFIYHSLYKWQYRWRWFQNFDKIRELKRTVKASPVAMTKNCFQQLFQFSLLQNSRAKKNERKKLDKEIKNSNPNNLLLLKIHFCCCSFSSSKIQINSEKEKNNMKYIERNRR